MEPYPIDSHISGQLCPEICFSELLCPAVYNSKDNYWRLHFSGSMSPGLHLGLVNGRHWQESRQWMKGKIKDMCLHLCLSKVVSSTTTVLPSFRMPPERPSVVPTSPSWFWSLNSGAITSSIFHLGLGVVIAFCFLISESTYIFPVLCPSSFITWVTSSLH